MSSVTSRILIFGVLLGVSFLTIWLLAPEVPETRLDWTVVQVYDGDTVVVERNGMEEEVRFIGIDTPERGECGYDEARQELVDIILDQRVTLVAGATTDRDRYDRLLRYVEYGGLDVGFAQIGQGLAHARYDSRSGLPHPREEQYREADAQVPHICDAQN
jgi:endonuclease YncB( thermonuclease family)